MNQPFHPRRDMPELEELSLPELRMLHRSMMWDVHQAPKHQAQELLQSPKLAAVTERLAQVRRGRTVKHVNW